MAGETSRHGWLQAGNGFFNLPIALRETVFAVWLIAKGVLMKGMEN